MRVYSYSQKNYYSYPAIHSNKAKQNIQTLNLVQKASADLFVNRENSRDINFTGLRHNYKGLLIKYIKMKSLRTSIRGSKRPYVSLKKSLEKVTKPVKIPVNSFERINAYDINPKNSDKYVIFLHGFSQNITNNQPLYESIIKTDYGVLALDYRGYGKNPKSIHITEADIAEDVSAAKKYLKQKGVNTIGLIGHSFGAYLSTKVSKSDFFNFQILVSPMLSLQFWVENVMKHPKKYRWENLLINKIPLFKDQYRKIFRMQKYVAKNSTPTYIIHSKTDRYIRYQDVDAFAQKLNKVESYALLERGGHKMDDYKIDAVAKTLETLK